MTKIKTLLTSFSLVGYFFKRLGEVCTEHFADEFGAVDPFFKSDVSAECDYRFLYAFIRGELLTTGSKPFNALETTSFLSPALETADFMGQHVIAGWRDYSHLWLMVVTWC